MVTVPPGQPAAIPQSHMDLQLEVEELRRQNTELLQYAEAGGEMLLESASLAGPALKTVNGQALASSESAAEVERLELCMGSLEQASRENSEAMAEVEDLARRLAMSEEVLARERMCTQTLSSELEQARAAAVCGDTSEVSMEMQALQCYTVELERRNAQLQGTIEALEQQAYVQDNEEANADQNSSGESAWRERAKSDELVKDMEQLKAELREERRRRGDAAEAVEEAKLLRAELAKRDRELLAVAAARRLSADQSERAAAILRIKFNELEAVVAATPSTPSRASSPACSDVDVGSPVNAQPQLPSDSQRHE